MGLVREIGQNVNGPGKYRKRVLAKTCQDLTKAFMKKLILLAVYENTSRNMGGNVEDLREICQ